MPLGFGIPVDVDAECAGAVDGLSIGFLQVCLTAGAVLCCTSCDPGGSVRLDVGFAIVGFGGLKSGLTLNHVSPVQGSPSSILVVCVGCKLKLFLKVFCCSISSLCYCSSVIFKPAEWKWTLFVMYVGVLSLSFFNIVTGEITALIPCSASEMSNLALTGILVVFIVR